MSAATMAPSSPRLPSPPPAAEDQLGPQSPMGAQANRQPSQHEQSLIDSNAKRRIHPGSKAQDMAAGPPLMPLNELDSAFQLQEHLAALHYYHTNSGTQPITRATAMQLATPPPTIDRTLWLYELCRFLISQCNTLIVGFLFDAPPCSASTCPEMRASEWQFLCAVHEQPKSCCAIDYCCHTLDWAANVVTDPKIFPSRFVVSSDAHAKGVAVKNLVNVFRRLHRIFAHAWFQHRAVFWGTEGQTGLYVFFKTVCDMYELLPAENYKLPPEAEGLETPAPAAAPADDDSRKHIPGPGVTIAKPPPRLEDPLGAGIDKSYQPVGMTNTRRHIRASPSTGSAVTTVMETDEEENDVANRLKGLTVSATETVEEESGVSEVPVIVEQEVPADSSPTEEEKEAPSPDGDADFTTETPTVSSYAEAKANSEQTDAATDAPVAAVTEVKAEPEAETEKVEPSVEVPPSTPDKPETEETPAPAPAPVEETPAEKPAEEAAPDVPAETEASDAPAPAAPVEDAAQPTESEDTKKTDEAKKDIDEPPTTKES
ncbi:Mob1/phocein family protein [Plectosphaerella plurivora]|uniref:Mob1/phocein family protein n=1 Tax=Plectosphaerella plurivora TaxID=936078 RepID=A0A9P8V7Y8_9PEZI|nr:Mob1/phocein family protein [Plectosphaerella plurivora]